MSASLNSLVGFNSKARNQYASRSYIRASVIRKSLSQSTAWRSESWRKVERLRLFVADSDRIALDSDAKESKDSAPLDPVENNPGSQNSGDNGSVPSSPPKSQSTPKRSPLTARERLRAARVLNKYSETKPSKSAMGSNVLDALKEIDRGKPKSRLPAAPTNLLDDSKRGMPKEGFTFEFPGGMDLFVVAFSVVFISTVMFATTYIVWKVGAIHFNEL